MILLPSLLLSGPIHVDLLAFAPLLFAPTVARGSRRSATALVVFMFLYVLGGAGLVVAGVFFPSFL
jgi:hypothetical protein